MIGTDAFGDKPRAIRGCWGRVEERRWKQRPGVHRTVGCGKGLGPPDCAPRRPLRRRSMPAAVARSVLVSTRQSARRGPVCRIPRSGRIGFRQKTASTVVTIASSPQHARHDRVSQDRLRDRRRIGQTGGLDDQPIKSRDLAVFASAEQAHHRLFHVAGEVAAQASRSPSPPSCRRRGRSGRGPAGPRRTH